MTANSCHQDTSEVPVNVLSVLNTLKNICMLCFRIEKYKTTGMNISFWQENDNFLKPRESSSAYRFLPDFILSFLSTEITCSYGSCSCYL